MYESILIPTDGSKGAQRGVDHALDLAAEHGATLHALYVVDERVHGTTPALSSDELYLETVEQGAETFLGEVVAQARAQGLEALPACIRGDPCEVILHYAREHDIDVIVMGHHGMVPERRPHLMGCVDEVSEVSEVPVLTV
ncbi:universal stress protein [Halobium salinum]|uniref:Universal stress protein n=1 Tax=Halobium salinum TaxID=1364940 RepID=A0ABD5PAP4_9EURY|nr:universal stress protein [Halobium salinum]